jgi:hypothetical protein
MAKSPKAKKTGGDERKPPETVQDEPGAEERFLRGIRKALSTPKPSKKPKAKRGAGRDP